MPGETWGRCPSCSPAQGSSSSSRRGSHGSIVCFSASRTLLLLSWVLFFSCVMAYVVKILMITALVGVWRDSDGLQTLSPDLRDSPAHGAERLGRLRSLPLLPTSLPGSSSRDAGPRSCPHFPRDHRSPVDPWRPLQMVGPAVVQWGAAGTPSPPAASLHLTLSCKA